MASAKCLTARKISARSKKIQKFFSKVSFPGTIYFCFLNISKLLQLLLTVFAGIYLKYDQKKRPLGLCL